MVYIKEVKTDSEEYRIAQLLTQEDWVNDPRNHCVPTVKLFEDHNNNQVSYIVMPFLRPINDPPFESVKEIIDFVDQILEVFSDVSISPVFSKLTYLGSCVPPREGCGSPVRSN